MLYVGNFMPHKNMPRLIRAFALLPGALRSRHSLVLAGGYGDGRPALARLAAVARPDGPGDLSWPRRGRGSARALLRRPRCTSRRRWRRVTARRCSRRWRAGRRWSRRTAPRCPEIVADAGLLFDPEQERELVSRARARPVRRRRSPTDLRRRATRARRALHAEREPPDESSDLLREVERAARSGR